MKIEKTNYTISLNAEEITTITHALHDLYKSLKNKSDRLSVQEEQLITSRILRNQLGDLVGIHYMGEDA